MSPLAISLLVIGGCLSLGGIILVAWPDLVPLFRWLRDAYRRAVDRVLRMTGRRRGRTVEVGGALSMAVGFGVSAVTSIGEEVSLEEKVAFLLRRDQEAQRHANDLSARLKDLEQGTPKRLDEVRAELKNHFAEKLAEALDRYRRMRISGAVAMAVGLICTIVASFV